MATIVDIGTRAEFVPQNGEPATALAEVTGILARYQLTQLIGIGIAPDGSLAWACNSEGSLGDLYLALDIVKQALMNLKINAHGYEESEGDDGSQT